MQMLRLSFNCLRPDHRSKDCKSRICSVLNCARRHNKLLHSDFPQKGARTSTSDATTAVATMILVVRIKLVNGNHSLSVLVMCDTGSSISLVDKSIVCTLQLQCQKLSLAGIHGSQDVKTEIVPIAVSAHEKSRPLATVQFYVHEKLKMGEQIVDLQGLRDRYPHLRNLPNQSYNLNEVQLFLGLLKTAMTSITRYNSRSQTTKLHHGTKIENRMSLRGLLPAKEVATLATTAASVSEDKLASHLSKW